MYVRHATSLLTRMAHDAGSPATAVATLMPIACVVDEGVAQRDPRKPLRIGLAHVALGHGVLQPGAAWMKHELALDALRQRGLEMVFPIPLSLQSLNKGLHHHVQWI